MGASAAIVGRRGTVAPGDSIATARWQDWQPLARRFAHTVGAAQFQANVVADCCARCDTRVEYNATGKADGWEASDDPRFDGLVDVYRNDLQGPDELVRLHAWHYNVAGEMVQTQRDVDGDVHYGIYSIAAVEWDKPNRGEATIKLVPDGKVDKGTAFAVPRDQVIRFWLPDQEWQAFATSPMAAVVSDLQRWNSLARYARSTAESMLAMSGLLWIPSDVDDGAGTLVMADTEAGETGNADGTASDLGTPNDRIEKQYYDAAMMRFADSDDVVAIAPLLVKWGKEFGKPEWVEMGRALDEQGIAHRTEALEDFARGTNLPNTTVLGGGVGDANHWSEWLATDKTFDSAIAPTMDRITYLDLTRAFLWPRALVAGINPDELGRWRIGYDPSPVLVKPDQSDNAIKLGTAGMLKIDTVLEAAGFDPGDKMIDPAERDWLLTVLSKRSQGEPAPGGESPVDGSNVVALPPARPTMTAAAGDSTDAGGEVAPDRAAERPTASVLRQLTRLRQSLGTRLLANAQHAYDDALRAAGRKVKTRARSRSSSQTQTRVAAAVDNREPLGPLLAMVKITDLELVDTAFDTFRARALDEISRYAERAEKVAGVPVVTEGDATAAVDYLCAALSAQVRARLLSGDEAILAASADLRRLAPRAPRRAPATGFDLPGLPDPDELSQAAAKLVRNALAISEGRASTTLPSTPDGIPSVQVRRDTPTIEERLALDVDVEPVWRWVHGFYGDPISPLDAHLSLDGFETTNRDGDPDLFNGEGWPDADLFAPGDHDGCTCEWVPA